MTALATKAREIAQHCEAKKHALRQTQDGIVVAFVLHPSDVPAALQLAPLGTRYMLALVEIGDDEAPINRKDGEANSSEQHQPVPGRDKTPPALVADTPVRARKPVASEKRLAMQAGRAASDPVFQTFLFESGQITAKDEDTAAMAIRGICEVASRAEIVPGSPAAIRWERLHGQFLAWEHA